ncbi:MAG: cyaB 1 [Mycobacterium sp.]|nr:cyaB 1 [Mycobacterium sp.]
MTVLFADVVHSMDIAAAVGAERLREIMAELVTRSGAVVKRFGGTVDKFTGDGIMAVFGAPVALEDHALRACLAALDIQRDAQHLAAEVDRRDGVVLQLRIGLNSGQVITGEIGSGAAAYTAIGEQVGMAQRMESVAAPGGIMLSDSTARLVENAAVLSEPELVHIKGADTPVPARRLTAVGSQKHRRRGESPLVGRTWELNTIAGILDEAIGGAGCVVGLVGPPGIGRADWCAKRPRSRPDAASRCSQPIASHTQPTCRSMCWPDCCARVWESRTSTPMRRGLLCASAFPTPSAKTCSCSRTCSACRILPRDCQKWHPTRVVVG